MRICGKGGTVSKRRLSQAETRSGSDEGELSTAVLEKPFGRAVIHRPRPSVEGNRCGGENNHCSETIAHPVKTLCSRLCEACPFRGEPSYSISNNVYFLCFGCSIQAPVFLSQIKYSCFKIAAELTEA